MSSLILKYTLPESTSLLGDVNGVITDSSQPLPPLMHMGYASAGRHPGKHTMSVWTLVHCTHLLVKWNMQNKLGQGLDVEYIWISWQGENCRQFSLLTWSSFSSFLQQEGSESGKVVLAHCKFHFIRVHENLV